MDGKKRLVSLGDLPLSIIEDILALLPIRDAVRTSVLSTKWRYTWRSLRQLVFSDDCVTFLPEKGILEEKLLKCINQVIYLQRGPIHKFEIRSSVIGRCRDIDAWMFFLSRQDLLELTINLEKCRLIRVPSEVFSCKNLSHLELSRCELDFPPTFKGFSCLKTLYLINPLVGSETLENFISNCPLLKRLTLLYNYGLDLKIWAPNLQHLCLEGKFKEICLQDTPQLEVMSIVLDGIEEHFHLNLDCNFIKIFGGVPNLRRLIGHFYLTKYLSVGIRQWEPLLQWNHLKIIDLHVDFDDFNEVLVVLRLITNSPNLQELRVSAQGWLGIDALPEDGDLWETECPSNCTLKQLKTVSVALLCGATHEMEFIGFLLENSPVLEEMSISSSSDDINDQNMYMLKQLLGLRRASPRAQILCDQF